MYHLRSKWGNELLQSHTSSEGEKQIKSPSTTQWGTFITKTALHIPSSSRRSFAFIHIYPSWYCICNFFPIWRSSGTMSTTHLDDQWCSPLLIRNSRRREILSKIMTTFLLSGSNNIAFRTVMVASRLVSQPQEWKSTFSDPLYLVKAREKSKIALSSLQAEQIALSNPGREIA